MKTLLRLFILTAPFTTWFALSGWMRLPIVFFLVAAGIGFLVLLTDIFNKPQKLFDDPEDILLILSTLAIVISLLLNIKTEKSFTHTLSFIFTFIILFIVGKRLISLYNFTSDEILSLIHKSTVLISTIVVTEWFLANFLDIVIRKWFIFAGVTSNMTLYGQFFFKSVAGVCEEPSLMAFNLNLYWPLGVYYLLRVKRNFSAVLLMAFSLFALFCTGSTGGLLFFLVAFGFSALTRISVLKGALTVLFFITVGFGLFYATSNKNKQNQINQFFATIAKKASFNHDSASMRSYVWGRGMADWHDSPYFGRGPGFGNLNYLKIGFQSLYVKMLAENGIFALAFFVFFVLILFIKILWLPGNQGSLYSISIITGLLHLFIADAFYHPALWVVFMLIQISYREFKDLKKLPDANT